MPSVTPVPGKPNLILGAYDIARPGLHRRRVLRLGDGVVVRRGGRVRSGGLHDPDRGARRRPMSTKFNGTVLVEWLNVSGGIDAPAVWMMAHREIARAGYAYVAVSAQKVGVDGGQTITGLDMSLKKQDPERYSDLSHPGDAFAYDIFSQVGRLIREATDDVLGRLEPGTLCGDRGIAVGDVPDDVHQRRRSAREGLRRLPGPFPVRCRGTAGRCVRIGGAASGHIGSGPVPAPICACR